ncbi:MAG: hypothetical protein ACOYD0_03105 [Candidatus Nanopelagicales bacterium]
MSVAKAAFVAALLVGATLTGAAPAAAASNGPCPTADGVTVVVDASALGGPVTQRCAAGEQSSGLVALANAGFEVTPVATQAALVCRIDNLPTPDSQSCQSGIRIDAYWAYFRADRGGPWRYSTWGAHTRPTPGGVEGWVFFTREQKLPGITVPPAFDRQDSAQPTAQPTRRPERVRPTPTPTKKPSKRPQQQTFVPTDDGSDSANAPLPPTRPAPTTSAPKPSQSPTQRVAGGYSGSSGADVSTANSGGGSLVSTMFGVGILALLLGTAGYFEVRRRRNLPGS